MSARVHRRLAAGSLALIALTAAGCGSSSSSTASPTTAAPAAPSASPTSSGGSTAGSTGGSSAKVPLVIYSAQGYDKAVTAAFAKATGIPVKLDDDSTGPLLTKIAAEANNPQWGLLWADGDTAFAALDKQGQLLGTTSPVALTAAGQSLVPADHAYVPVSTTVVPAMIYNAARVKAVPSTFADLLTAPYKGMVGMNDPSQSGPTFPLIAGVMNQLGGQANGVKAGEAYFGKLKANGLKVFPTNGDTLHALQTGQINYGIIQSSAATGEVATAKKTSAYDPKIVYLPTSTLLPGVIGIDKRAPAAEQAEAKQFLAYVLSAAGQKAMQAGDPTGDGLFWPVVPGVAAATYLPAIPARYQKLDPYFWGPLEGSVNTWFDTTIK